MSGDGLREVELPDATALVAGDPWLLEAYTQVASDPARDPRVRVLPFEVGPGAGLHGEWRLRGVGQGIVPTGGRPTPFHPPEGPDRVRAFMNTEPRGRVYYLALWAGAVPLLVEVWELRLDRAGVEAQGHLWWRPGYAQPEVAVTGGRGLGHTRREALMREIWTFLEPQSPAGRKPGEREPDPKWEGELEEAVRDLIIEYDGKPRIEDVQTKLVCKPGEYYGRLAAVGLKPKQVGDWIRTCARDYRDKAGDDAAWRLPIRLADLPRDFGN